LAYKPYVQYNGDIASYLQYNFGQRANVYNGKTFADLMNDIEIKPLEFSPMFRTDNVSTGIFLGFKFSSESHAFVPWKDEFITIRWEMPFNDSLMLSLIKTYPYKIWVTQHYDFFKNLRIHDVTYK
jgi:hypothetical protein